MNTPWKERLRAAGEDLLVRHGPVKVLVDLEHGTADGPCLARLERLGLMVQEVARTKIIGTIEGALLDVLRRDPQVREVEIAHRLRPTGKASSTLLPHR